jgi:ArsR family transcriptional regulator, arsenate/arsenite/antimonite-responsive transcriptional repressor
MPASKAKNFTPREQELAFLGRALSHPARVRILDILDSNAYIRNVDLIKSLHLSKASVQNHVKKLEEVKLVSVNYAMNSFYIMKSEEAKEKIKDYLNDLS